MGRSTEQRAVRADFDADTIVVYQAFSDRIADAAMAAGRLVAPFSRGRMSWIKPSFRWLMVRSQWASKPGQTRILALRIPRTAWEDALGRGVLTDPDRAVHSSVDAWRAAFEDAEVHVQWDPERSARGAKLPERSIQVGLGRAVVGDYAGEWIQEVRDLTERARQIKRALQGGDARRATRLLPTERPYPLPDALRRRLGVA